MTTQSLAGEVQAEVLASCDRLLGEVGRRGHMFGWLRDPQADRQQWLPVDAYYPRHRLVVLCPEEPSPHERLYAELIPAHGLRLVTLAPAELRDDPQGLTEALKRALADASAPAAIARAPTAREQPPARGGAHAPAPRKGVWRPRPGPPARMNVAAPDEVSGPRAAAVQRASRFVSARISPSREPIEPRLGKSHAEALPLDTSRALAGAVLALVVLVELYVAVSVVAIGSGSVLLAFGLAVDAGARALGAIAAARCGRQDWTWLCVLVGSPAVTAFTLLQNEGPVRVDPAPLAALLSMVAIGLVVLAILAALLGI